MVAVEVECSSVSCKVCALVDESEFDLVVASFALLEAEPNFDCFRVEGPSRFSPDFTVFSTCFTSLLSISEALISLLWTT